MTEPCEGDLPATWAPVPKDRREVERREKVDSLPYGCYLQDGGPFQQKRTSRK